MASAGRRGYNSEGQIVYVWFSAHHTYTYIGKSVRGLGARTVEHYTQILGQKGSKKDLPAYDVIRRLGWSHFIARPVVRPQRSNDLELQYVERQ